MDAVIKIIPKAHHSTLKAWWAISKTAWTECISEVENFQKKTWKLFNMLSNCSRKRFGNAFNRFTRISSNQDRGTVHGVDSIVFAIGKNSFLLLTWKWIQFLTQGQVVALATTQMKFIVGQNLNETSQSWKNSFLNFPSSLAGNSPSQRSTILFSSKAHKLAKCKQSFHQGTFPAAPYHEERCCNRKIGEQELFPLSVIFIGRREKFIRISLEHVIFFHLSLSFALSHTANFLHFHGF